MSEICSSPDELKIGFVALQESGERGYRGALLVTDRYSTPVEFRCTSAVNPTRMQRILYGKTLLPHIALRLVALPLIEAVSVKPGILVVQERVFLALRDLLNQPVLYIRQKIGESAQKLATEQPSSSQEDSDDDPFALVALECNRKNLEDLHTAREMLRDCADLLEPFERIEEALKTDEERGHEPPR